jgi:hypothetical protein
MSTGRYTFFCMLVPVVIVFVAFLTLFYLKATVVRVKISHKQRGLESCKTWNVTLN